MFIEKEKFAKLRDAARSGDERAASILDSFRHDSDISGMMEEYFKPVETETATIEVKGEEPDRDGMSKLERFLTDNEVHEGDDNYDDYVKEFYEMFPEEHHEHEHKHEECCEKEEDPVVCEIQKLMKEEVDAIESYSKGITIVMSSNLPEKMKRRIIARLEEILGDEKEHHSELGKELQSLLNLNNGGEEDIMDMEETTL